ncbi:D-alanyl-D-alanine carboxypeptidase / D-alanyl-D-alanine-endopeptidase (penicillin-binding protein 4) [Streptomyces harbinensis]|uniref:D-alanyl-D-alanine carboxypeptidase / D-alanyl-D-alanine-endopeptidase (Penicillin-binding protein 4) n=1 Tax=Streptomyces harbinensis TaxID=1176198 RepID=A0A1I6TI00_9ACTN|nr:D-alanyl-D-alanine carboxypeptidase / D-alanyl-D-alanine-endopeptidase (penicillin-binding protein 4) [Streptomyces harbinensis]
MPVRWSQAVRVVLGAPTRRLVTAAAAAGLATAALTVALSGPWDSGQRTAERHAAAGIAAEREVADLEKIVAGLPSAPPVLDPLGERVAGSVGSAGSAGTAGLVGALAPLGDAALGSGGAAVSVVDIADGTVLYASGEDAARTPASTVKLVTSVAALRALGPDHRLSTTVGWDEAARRVVLVGGGDPTVLAADYAALAEETAAELTDRGISEVSVGYDLSLWDGGEGLHPIGVNDNIAPLTPLQVNEGRLDDSTHGPTPRSTDPAADAVRTFTDALRAAGVTVTGEPERAGGQDTERLARHRSAPMSVLVERMLTYSDNDLAEALGRAVAVKAGQPVTFAGVGRAIGDELTGLGLSVDGVRIADASGLDRSGQLTARLLTGVLTAAADPAHPELRPALTGMPVAGFTGTLTGRYGAGTDGAADGAGVVRAKTGTLTGVNTLAGTAVTADGRVLAFAFLAADTTDANAAQTALDRAATALATCSCG